MQLDKKTLEELVVANTLTNPTNACIVRYLMRVKTADVPEIAEACGLSEHVTGYSLLRLRAVELVDAHYEYDEVKLAAVAHFTATPKVKETVQRIAEYFTL